MNHKSIILPSTTTVIPKDIFNVEEAIIFVFCLATHPPLLSSDTIPKGKHVRFFVPNVKKYKASPMWEHVSLSQCIEQINPIYYTGYKSEYTNEFYKNNLPFDITCIGYYHYGTKISYIIDEGSYDAIFKIENDEFNDTIVSPFKITSVEDDADQHSISISISPNPATDIITVRGPLQGNKLIVFNNLNEKMIEEIACKNSTKIYIASLPDGIYYVSCKGSISKFIKV